MPKRRQRRQRIDRDAIIVPTGRHPHMIKKRLEFYNLVPPEGITYWELCQTAEQKWPGFRQAGTMTTLFEKKGLFKIRLAPRWAEEKSRPLELFPAEVNGLREFAEVENAEYQRFLDTCIEYVKGVQYRAAEQLAKLEREKTNAANESRTRHDDRLD